MNDIDPRDRRQTKKFPDPHTVLITDDSSAIRMILKKTLQAEGIRVNEASNGSEALAYCDLERPALILLDIDMPVMDGITTLRQLKANPDLASIPVLMLTAHTDADDVAKAFELGAQDYLRKPCAPVELLARVKGALAISDQQQYLYRRAEELGVESETDQLTGLGNRRQLARHISELRTQHGDSASIGIVMVDIDHFKVINDERGHLVGDEVLRGLAERLTLNSGESTLVIRWGGEEFVTVVLQPGPGAIFADAESVRTAVEAQPFAIADADDVIATISVGCALGPIGSLSHVLEAADAALYRAKESGRNRTACDTSCAT